MYNVDPERKRSKSALNMKKSINLWAFRIVRFLHKKTELRLQECKKQKLHGTPQYQTASSQERKLRDLKKMLQCKIEEPAARGRPRR